MQGHEGHLWVRKRSDGKWMWELEHGGQTIATDGNQGYENRSECVHMGEAVKNGFYARSRTLVVTDEDEA